MPRRRPDQVGAVRRHKMPPGQTVSVVTGVSARTQSDISRFEDTRLSPGEVAAAVAGWARMVRAPVRRLVVSGGCEVYGCCDHRRTLEQALRVLPPRSGRELRCVVQPLDEIYLSRTVEDSTADPSAPWWARRC
jgi:hypothetical protein